MPWRTVQWLSDAPNASTTSAFSQQPYGERGGEASRYPDAVRVAGKEPVPHRARREHGSDPISQGLERLARVCKGGALPSDDRRPVRESEQVRDRGDGTLRRTRRLQRWPVRDGRWAVGAVLFDHVDRDAQDDGAALGLRAPERPGGVGGGGLGPTHALGNRADRRRQGGLIYLEVRPERPCRNVRGQHDERRAGLCGLRQPRERVRKARALMDACDADLPRGAGVAVRHHDRAALVAGGVERGARRV